MNSTAWQLLPEPVRARIVKAMNVQYGQRNCPTYKPMGPIAIEAILRKHLHLDIWTPMKLKGGEKMAPASITGDKYLIMTPTTVELLKLGITRLRLNVSHALDQIEGFSEQMEQVMMLIDDEMLVEIRQQKLAAEIAVRKEEEELMQFKCSDAWGEF